MNSNSTIIDTNIKEVSCVTDTVESSINCIDLFCRVGGLTHGLIRGGIRVIAGIDIDPQCRFPYQSIDGYSIWYDVVDCTEYGIPQTRKRLVLLASRVGPIELVPPNIDAKQSATVWKFISHLPPLAAGDSDPEDSLHTASALSDLNLRRIKASKPGGTWRDWDDELLAPCHRKGSGQTYPSVYGRMEWNAPALMITTQCFGFGNGRFGHPQQHRAISLREAAILQTVPDDYRFVAPG